ncbi:MAG: hypothetical protein FJX77_08485 [Armatimonadetes bacterium]|nr:hypothetical protein [Armatimonadota bacterium]
MATNRDRWRRWGTASALLLGLGSAVVAVSPDAGPWKHRELRRFAAREANQGVAVDAGYFYAIDNRALGKYRKSTGERVGGWEGPAGGRIKHLNAGAVVAGKLYCAHSNYPDQPEESSVEIWATETMRPVGRHVFEKPPGSLTWVVPRGEGWLACFAHYRTTSDPARSRVVQFDRNWQPRESWRFPAPLVERFAGYSASGGDIGPGERLFVTGHDARELYVLELPDGGGELVWRATLPISAAGQAFAWDRGTAGSFYSIERKTREVIVARITRDPGATAVRFQAATCEGVYPLHLQGVATDGREALFWSWTDTLAKTDLRGRLLRRVPAENHQGDLCVVDGKVYVAVNLREFNEPAGRADSWVYVYDARTLERLARHPVPEAVHGAGGIAHHDGRFLVVGGLPPGVPQNFLYEYDTRFRFRKRHELASGYTRLGIQTVTWGAGSWWFGCYGTPQVLLRADAGLRLTGRWEFNASLGLEGLPDGRFLIGQNTETPEGYTGRVEIARWDAAKGLVVEKGE